MLDKWHQIDDEIWAKLIVMERNRRVAKAYARAIPIQINGSDDGFDGFRYNKFSLLDILVHLAELESFSVPLMRRKAPVLERERERRLSFDSPSVVVIGRVVITPARNAKLVKDDSHRGSGRAESASDARRPCATATFSLFLSPFFLSLLDHFPYWKMCIRRLEKRKLFFRVASIK